MTTTADEAAIIGRLRNAPGKSLSLTALSIDLRHRRDWKKALRSLVARRIVRKRMSEAGVRPGPRTCIYELVE